MFLTFATTAWGDGDALAEAGFCYAQGLGCKKDLKKSARFYRLAESKGISMVGNSWYLQISVSVDIILTNDRIYKSKYKDDNGDNEPKRSPDKKNRSRSRTRSIFRLHKPKASS